MRAILLAGGIGTRLRPLTYKVPKCLVPVQGKPLLEFWLDRLSRCGIDRMLVNTHYLSEMVEDYVNGSQYQDAITLVHEPRLLGTAGTLIANIDFFESEDGLLMHADNYCLDDMQSFFAAHNRRPTRCLITMMTFNSSDPSSAGIVEIDDDGVVVNFHEKIINPPGDLANGAIYILSAEAQSFIVSTLPTATDFSSEVIPHFINRIYTYHTDKLFIDIGTHAAYRTIQG